MLGSGGLREGGEEEEEARELRQQRRGKSFIWTYQELLWDSTDGAKATTFSER